MELADLLGYQGLQVELDRRDRPVSQGLQGQRETLGTQVLQVLLVNRVQMDRMAQ